MTKKSVTIKCPCGYSGKPDWSLDLRIWCPKCGNIVTSYRFVLAKEKP